LIVRFLISGIEIRNDEERIIIITTASRENCGRNCGETSVKTLVKTLVKILELAELNNAITIPKIFTTIGISEQSLERNQYLMHKMKGGLC